MSENRAVGGIPNYPLERPGQGKNYLFAVGINTYRDEKIPKLSNACRDIIDLASLLKEDYNFNDQTLLLDEEATRSNIINKLNELPQKISPDDKLLIYYSGHGKVDEYDDTRGYWIPVDGILSDKSSFVTNADVTDIIKSINARHILLISDSCFSAALLQKFRSLDEEGAYDQMEKAKSRWAFVSGKGVVSDGDDGENSPFAKGIIKQLTKNKDKINISLLADQVMKQVSNVYDQEAIAIPLRTKEHEEGGQFVFVKKQTEKEIWAMAIAQNDEGSYLDYLYKYPDGIYKIEAEKKLKDIADENEWNKANEKNAAFAYRHYLKIYPDGMHVKEANDRLEEIRSEDIRENEKEIEESQRNNIDTQNEKKDKKIENPRPKPQSFKINKNHPGFIKKNIFLIALFGLIIIPGSVIWFLKTVKSSARNADNSPFWITGVIVDLVNNDSLSGIVLRNNRTKDSTTTSDFGTFFLDNTLEGDTIFIAENANYESDTYAVGKVEYLKEDESGIKSMGVIGLRQKPKIEYKSIFGTVTGNMIWKVHAVRDGKVIEPIWNGRGGGNYSLEGVTEGDILWLVTSKGNILSQYNCKISKKKFYDFYGDSLVAHD